MGRLIFNVLTRAFLPTLLAALGSTLYVPTALACSSGRQNAIIFPDLTVQAPRNVQILVNLPHSWAEHYFPCGSMVDSKVVKFALQRLGGVQRIALRRTDYSSNLNVTILLIPQELPGSGIFEIIGVTPHAEARIGEIVIGPSTASSRLQFQKPPRAIFAENYLELVSRYNNKASLCELGNDADDCLGLRPSLVIYGRFNDSNSINPNHQIPFDVVFLTKPPIKQNRIIAIGNTTRASATEVLASISIPLSLLWPDSDCRLLPETLANPFQLQLSVSILASDGSRGRLYNIRVEPPKTKHDKEILSMSEHSRLIVDDKSGYVSIPYSDNEKLFGHYVEAIKRAMDARRQSVAYSECWQALDVLGKMPALCKQVPPYPACVQVNDGIPSIPAAR